MHGWKRCRRASPNQFTRKGGAAKRRTGIIDQGINVEEVTSQSPILVKNIPEKVLPRFDKDGQVGLFAG
jgi:hypothetical protein